MKVYNVVIRAEQTIEVEADNEDMAEMLAHGMFDPTSFDPEIVEIWTNDEGDEDE
jgi:hypothetical protein